MLPMTSAVKNDSGLANDVVQDNVESGGGVTGFSNEGSRNTGGPEVTVQRCRWQRWFAWTRRQHDGRV